MPKAPATMTTVDPVALARNDAQLDLQSTQKQIAEIDAQLVALNDMRDRYLKVERAQTTYIENLMGNEK